MMLYTVVFYHQGRPVCSTLQRADTSDLAEFAATVRFMCAAPNITFDGSQVREVQCND